MRGGQEHLLICTGSLVLPPGRRLREWRVV
ncbi:unnamed protein product [Linum tenue]|uniref:Uncharacterized protein n=1 Tax=Linum tenue TaxID=586396 RepID=A0AAV0ME34_9ROSI|nr:unnamed protein product [Linum tenue]